MLLCRMLKRQHVYTVLVHSSQSTQSPYKNRRGLEKWKKCRSRQLDGCVEPNLTLTLGGITRITVLILTVLPWPPVTHPWPTSSCTDCLENRTSDYTLMHLLLSSPMAMLLFCQCFLHLELITTNTMQSSPLTTFKFCLNKMLLSELLVFGAPKAPLYCFQF